jgi:hypothetical protein
METKVPYHNFPPMGGVDVPLRGRRNELFFQFPTSSMAQVYAVLRWVEGQQSITSIEMLRNPDLLRSIHTVRCYFRG